LIRRESTPKNLNANRLRNAAAIGFLAGVFALTQSSVTAQDEVAEFAEAADPGAGLVNLDIQSDFSDYDQNLGIAKAHGDVIVKYGDVTIRADQIEYHPSSGNLFARDNVCSYNCHTC
jgi:lipopolysaccharide assembly outer membrane protein LptD (OstA)